MDPWTLLVAIPKTDDLEMKAVCDHMLLICTLGRIRAWTITVIIIFLFFFHESCHQ